MNDQDTGKHLKTVDDASIVSALSSIADTQTAILKSLAALTEGKLPSDTDFMMSLLTAIEKAKISKEHIEELQTSLDNRTDDEAVSMSLDIIKKAKE
ncbi:hypothetical protein LJC19_05050 [Oxalobacter sp. OttesenSCG-928-P03]|nr:hypothetical protein [Oxalobacter sp. OttesenSCG-928-P03]